MNRDMVWHELYNRMRRERCPICELIRSRTKKSMEGFLYESVNDRALRDLLCRAGGLCNDHAYMLLDMGDPLAHALIYHDLLERAVRYVRETPPRKRKERYQGHPSCLFCRQAEASEHIYVESFMDAFRDDEFKVRYTDGGLLCVPHLEMMKNDGKHGNAGEIIEVTTEKYEALLHQLSEIRRKNDYRFAGEPWTEQEKTAWQRAVAVINALRGVKL